MFFKHKDHRKRAGGIIGLFRLLLSLIMMAVLGFALYQAYVNFSGVDPLKLNPKAIVSNLTNSEKLVDFLTGLLSVSPSQSLEKAKDLLQDKGEGQGGNGEESKANLKFKFAVVGDPHVDTNNLRKALSLAKEKGAKFIIGIGDMSNVGTVDELSNTKKQYDAVGLPYYVTTGDHDLWDSRDKNLSPDQNFKQVFGPTYQSFGYEDTRFILVYNSDNYLGLDGLQLKWVEDELARASDANLIFVIAGTPLFHPSSDHVMGKVEPKLKNQAEHLIDMFKKNGVKEVFAGDTHFFSRYTEPKLGLKMTTVGAVTSERNPQTPRFAMVEVFDDGSYNVEEVEVK